MSYRSITCCRSAAPTHAEGYVQLRSTTRTRQLVDSSALLLSYYKLPGAPGCSSCRRVRHFDFPLHRSWPATARAAPILQLTNDVTSLSRHVRSPPTTRRSCFNRSRVRTLGSGTWTCALATTRPSRILRRDGRGVTMSPSRTRRAGIAVAGLPGLATTFGGDGRVVIDRFQPWDDGAHCPSRRRPSIWTRSQAIAVDADGTQHDYSMSTDDQHVRDRLVGGMRAARRAPASTR